jgi:uncharacterized BrkB/YihY/UPF0761 family membrane protein
MEIRIEPSTNYQSSYAPPEQAPVTVGDWVLTILVTAIPLVGLIMLFVWAFSVGTNVSKANWAKAMLIWALIGMVLSILIGVFLGTRLLRNYYY